MKIFIIKAGKMKMAVGILKRPIFQLLSGIAQIGATSVPNLLKADARITEVKGIPQLIIW